jgi:hypothetical protein
MFADELPYDVFDLLRDLILEQGLQFLYFFLVGCHFIRNVLF